MAKGVVCVLAGVASLAQGVRVSRHGASPGKTIAGLPVLNYNLAYDGRVGVSSETKEHWIVIAKKGVSTETLQQLCESSGACEKVGNPSAGGAPFFEVHTTEWTLEKVLSGAVGDLEFVETDGTFSLDPEEDERNVEVQDSAWGIDRVGVNDAAYTGVGVSIYVLDTGVRTTHNDFGARGSPALDVTNGELEECAGDTTCAGDRRGHGTHCAGTAAGTQYGVAPDAKVFGVKVLGDGGSGSFSWFMQGLDWVASKTSGNRVASMSLGGRRIFEAMEPVVDAAVSAGCVVVVAGGNFNDDACLTTPAYIESAITVGSTARGSLPNTDVRSPFSNYGRCTQMWAPGSFILSAGHTSDTDTDVKSGTSMACPHVAGAVALLWEEAPATATTAVLGILQERSMKDRIQGLRPEDVNYLLWVGAGDPPPPAAPCRRRLLCGWQPPR